MKLSKKLFYLIIFVLPLNLGKHFIFPGSYVKGLPIDYLIPTLYVQDVLIVILLCTWVVELPYFVKDKNFSLKSALLSKTLAPVYFFVFSLFLSTLVSPIFNVSLLSFLRTLLYFFFFLYIYTNLEFSKDFGALVKISFLSFFLVSLLGIAQFAGQKSVFSNYLFFGEQPYTFSTPGITHESVLGFTLLPSYGLFKHPNAFGGLLSILLIWMLPFFKKSKLYYLYFLTMFVAMTLTFSWVSYASFFVGILCYYLVFKENIKLKQPLKFRILPVVAGLIFVFSLSIPFFTKYFEISSNSLPRRANLLESSYNLIQDNFYYGVGFNSYTAKISAYLLYLNAVSFLQPVHNVFVLILSESGVFSFLLFLGVIFLTFFRTKHTVLLISLVQIVLLSSFDHYFWTMHQPHLFLWLLLGLCWTRLREC